MHKHLLALLALTASFAAHANDSYKAVDAQLNKTYQEIVARLKDDADGKKSLVDAQRAWMKFRDAECKFQASAVDGGSAYPLAMQACLEAVTRQRVQELERYTSCEEGDLTCPVPR